MMVAGMSMVATATDCSVATATTVNPAQKGRRTAGIVLFSLGAALALFPTAVFIVVIWTALRQTPAKAGFSSLVASDLEAGEKNAPAPAEFALPEYGGDIASSYQPPPVLPPPQQAPPVSDYSNDGAFDYDQPSTGDDCSDPFYASNPFICPPKAQ